MFVPLGVCKEGPAFLLCLPAGWLELSMSLSSIHPLGLLGLHLSDRIFPPGVYHPVHAQFGFHLIWETFCSSGSFSRQCARFWHSVPQLSAASVSESSEPCHLCSTWKTCVRSAQVPTGRDQCPFVFPSRETILSTFVWCLKPTLYCVQISG